MSINRKWVTFSIGEKKKNWIYRFSKTAYWVDKVRCGGQWLQCCQTLICDLMWRYHSLLPLRWKQSNGTLWLKWLHCWRHLNWPLFFLVNLCSVCCDWDRSAPGKYWRCGWHCTNQCSWERKDTGARSYLLFPARQAGSSRWNTNATAFGIVHWPKVQKPWLSHRRGQSQRSIGCKESLSATPSECAHGGGGTRRTASEERDQNGVRVRPLRTEAPEKTPLSVKWLRLSAEPGWASDVV